MPLIHQQELERITEHVLMLELPDSFNYIPSYKICSKYELQSFPIGEQNRWLLARLTQISRYPLHF